MKEKNNYEDISGYSTDILWVGFQVRNYYEKVKNDIKKLISKK